MSAPTIRRNIAIAAVIALIIGVILAITVGVYAPLIGVGVLVLATRGLVNPEKAARAKTPVIVGAGVIGIGIAVGAYALDSSWISGVCVLACVAAVLFVWVSLVRQLRPTAPLSAAAVQALGRAGVTMAEESLAGWSSGMSRNGALIMVREIDPESGPVDKWKTLTRLAPAVTSVKKTMLDQGLNPLVLLLPKSTPGIVHRTDSFTVCSLDKLTPLVSSAAAVMADPKALATQAGISINRAVTRRLASGVPGTPRPAKAKVIHSGRVTKKATD